MDPLVVLEKQQVKLHHLSTRLCLISFWHLVWPMFLYFSALNLVKYELTL